MRGLSELFGDIDIYLFDQLLRGRLKPGMAVLDAGCGSGRNITYLLRAGYDVRGADRDPAAVAAVRELAALVRPGTPVSNFRQENIEDMSFADDSADFVISSAVLHFARDDSHFLAMLRGMWRVLKRRGVLFCRLASSIGIEHQIRQTGENRFLLPDGTERYLVKEASLIAHAQELGAELLDPLKTTVVHNQRSMTTWILGKL